MSNACTANRGHILHYLDKGGVVTHNLSQVQYIDGNMVKIVKNVHKSVPNPYNTWQPILPENIHNPLAPKIKQTMEEVDLKADIVIIAAGLKANDSLYYDLVKNNVAPEIYNIGDSFKPGKVFTATKYAYRKARSI